MRLINTTTLKLTEFYGNSIPKYAILSHTWELDEVAFEEFQNVGPTTEVKAGYAKIARFCSTARTVGYEWAWMDTCCIDKTSSAELSEAINSMFEWYQQSEICFVYLSDVVANDDQSNVLKDFSQSRWFTRGWTLQELIAPSGIIFFDKTWRAFGRKTGAEPQYSGTLWTLYPTISEKTAIDARLLKYPYRKSLSEQLAEYSVAQKMSWAAKRVTTRVEDGAYSLLGLFGVNIPLLYGEGSNAFQRLQEEIVRTIDDQSVFAWGHTFEEIVRSFDDQSVFAWGQTSEENLYLDSFKDYGIFATSADQFARSADIVTRKPTWNTLPMAITNRGVSIECLMVSSLEDSEAKFIILECSRIDQPLTMIAISVAVSESGSHYRRKGNELHNISIVHLVGLQPQNFILTTDINSRSQSRNPEEWDMIVDFAAISQQYGARIHRYSQNIEYQGMDEGYMLTKLSTLGTLRAPKFVVAICFEHKDNGPIAPNPTFALIVAVLRSEQQFDATAACFIWDDNQGEDKDAWIKRLVKEMVKDFRSERNARYKIQDDYSLIFMLDRKVLVMDVGINKLFGRSIVHIKAEILSYRTEKREIKNIKDKIALRSQTGDRFDMMLRQFVAAEEQLGA